MSNSVRYEPYETRREYYLREKYERTKNQATFIDECIQEQVLPSSAPRQLQSDEHPFTKAARAYLEDGKNSLINRTIMLKNRFERQLPHHLNERLRRNSEKHQKQLKEKLHRLCLNSTWKDAGNKKLISNLSSRILNETEKEALSLGLKFDTGKNNKSFLDFIIKNTKNEDSEIDKGFKQGLVTCLTALADSKRPSLPRRYLRALQDLSRDRSIVITPSDKGGGVVILDKSSYDLKMLDLLSDDSVYERVKAGTCRKASDRFNKEVRKILRRTDRGKRLLHLVEEKPRSPLMRGVPKTHKDGIPLRPITSGIGSAPHRLAKCLAKPLSAALGSISESHLKNSADLLDRIRDLDINERKMVSFDVKSLFTNVCVDGAIKALKRVLEGMSEEQIPLPKDDFTKLVKLCVDFGCFEFDGNEYRQRFGLAMGNPLSAVLAPLYMEVLEVDHFNAIVGPEVSWFRYCDDILAFVPDHMDLTRLTQQLNSVDKNIQFTLEEEKQNVLPFLDVLIHRCSSGLRFSVYRKPTNKDDLIHYFSDHSHRTKSGVVLGFYLRALRICSPEYLDDEMNHIVSVFYNLKFPLAMLIQGSSDKLRQIQWLSLKKHNFVK